MRVLRGLPFPSASPCVLTIGNFDGLHRGHRAMLDHLLAEARRRDLPTAVLTFEPHPRELFAPTQAPARLTGLRDKLALLRDAGIDRVYLAHFNRALAGLSPEAFARDVLAAGIGACYVLVGDDFRFGQARAGDIAQLARLGDRYGFEAEAMPEIAVGGERASSTAVRAALSEGDLMRANRLLGRPYAISGRVVHGQKLGRTIGFPTANLHLRARRLPLQGIFAVAVHGAAPHPLMGAASLAPRPTVEDSGAVMLEVFLLDFEGDLYGRRLRVDFLHKLRDTIQYASLDALSAQIAQDVADTRAFFDRHPLPERISGPRP